MAEGKGDIRQLRALAAERDRLAELYQNRSRHAAVLEDQIRRLIARLDLRTATIDIAEPLRPVGDGVHLGTPDRDRPPYRRPEPAADRRLDAPSPWWPGGDGPAAGMVPNAGSMNHALQGRVATVIGVSVLGQPRAELEAIMNEIASRQAELANFAPVFIYDGGDFDLFRHHGWVVEWLPPPEDQARFDGALGWDAYCRERIAFLRQKWSMVDLIDHNRASPAEPPAAHEGEPARRDGAEAAA